MNPPRVVLHTNCVVSALVFGSGRFLALRQRWQSQQVTPLASHDTVSELLRVLAYPKFRLSPGEQQTLLGDYLPWVETVRLHTTPTGLPPVRDDHDVMFLALARCARADALVTGDSDLLAVGAQFEIPILTPAGFEDWLGQRR
ncbi:MAG: putative toxin-antitoxin system toxin component, PIN family [Myxococcales bacterium]|nr:putative toxin-antitoxin system toxin component, PIN family [Myxococcales bacterium]